MSLSKVKRYGQGVFLELLGKFLNIDTELKLLRHNTNLIYDAGDLVVRLTPNSFRPRVDVIRELHWMLFLQKYTDNVVKVFGDDRFELVTKMLVDNCASNSNAVDHGGESNSNAVDTGASNSHPASKMAFRTPLVIETTSKRSGKRKRSTSGSRILSQKERRSRSYQCLES